MRENFDVVVIGGGTTGTAAIRDLVLRGYTNSVLLERDDLAAGTSGGCHSALHGGSRYVVTDKQTAVECLQENKVFREIVPQVVDRQMQCGWQRQKSSLNLQRSGWRMQMRLACPMK